MIASTQPGAAGGESHRVAELLDALAKQMRINGDTRRAGQVAIVANGMRFGADRAFEPTDEDLQQLRSDSVNIATTRPPPRHWREDPKARVAPAAPRLAATPVAGLAARYTDIGGQDYINAVLKVAHSQPRANPNDDSWLEHWRSAKAAGVVDAAPADAEITRLQRQIAVNTMSESRRSAILSALATGDRARLREALAAVPGTDALQAPL